MTKKFVKKPIEVEALQWTGGNHREMFEFLGGENDKYLLDGGKNFYIDHFIGEGGLMIKTSEGDMFARIGDFVVKEPFNKDRKYYPVKESIMPLTYDEVSL